VYKLKDRALWDLKDLDTSSLPAQKGPQEKSEGAWGDLQVLGELIQQLLIL
jgi:hypothetical protein